MKKREIIKYWRNVRRLTLELLERFPEDRFDFRPAPGMRTVAGQFGHILGDELYMRRGICEDVWPAYAADLEHFNKADLRDRLAREHEETARMLRVLPEPDFTRLYQTPFGTITGEGLVYVSIDEEIHHRGNLYVYLRILGIEPPQMVQHYGEIFTED